MSRGPSTRKEKKLWDLIQGRTVEFEAELPELEALRGDPDCPQEILFKDIEPTRKVLAIINAANRRWGGVT